MGVGACLLSNEPAEAKDQLIQARLDGKTWKQIQEEFGFSSVQAARKTFRKVTGINNLNIKGKDLKDMLDAGMMDELKKVTPKKPPKPKLTPEGDLPAPSNTAVAFEGPQGTGTGLTGEQFDIMNDAFPHTGKTTLDNIYQAEVYAEQSYVKAYDKAKTTFFQVEDQYGDDVIHVWANIQQGQYYSQIATKYGMEFSDIDAIFWKNAMQESAKQVNGDLHKVIWNAYAKKPTSETGYKAVQDLVWNMKKVGASAEDIAKVTGVPDDVVKLILKDEWSLPAKGSKTYVGYNSPAVAPPATPYSQVSTQLIGESNNFANMTKAQADAWVQSLGNSLSPTELKFMREYTGSSYFNWNQQLRGGYTSSETQRAAEHISSGMKAMPNDHTLYRGVGREALPGGKIPEVGDSYTDGGFMSTSFGDHAAFSSKEVLLVIDAPKGTKAYPVHQLSLHKGENEILLDKDQKFVVTGVQRHGNKVKLFLKVVL